jgi:hypothetical protein
VLERFEPEVGRRVPVGGQRGEGGSIIFSSQVSMGGDDAQEQGFAERFRQRLAQAGRLGRKCGEMRHGVGDRHVVDRPGRLGLETRLLVIQELCDLRMLEPSHREQGGQAD